MQNECGNFLSGRRAPSGVISHLDIPKASLFSECTDPFISGARRGGEGYVRADARSRCPNAGTATRCLSAGGPAPWRGGFSGGWCLEDGALRRFFESVPGGLLLASAFVALGLITVRDALGWGGKARSRRLDRGGKPAITWESEIAGEFCFGRAIPAYEALIDTVGGTVAGEERG